MRSQGGPERRASSGFQRMRSDPQHAGPLARIGAVLAGFVEEVDPARRPFHTAAAISQGARGANRFFELIQDRIEVDEVFQPSGAHDFLRPRQTCCHPSNSLGLMW